ncbi:MAG: antitoxin MazE family protein [Thermomicrobiales bacterium]|nr:antitoxin MazE family protein [Thermomicrobiales bacterium]
MVTDQGKKSSRAKVGEHRKRLRAKGLRPIQIWVPDVRSPEFRAEAHRQSALVAASPHEPEDQAFVDSASAGVWSDE